MTPAGPDSNRFDTSLGEFYAQVAGTGILSPKSMDELRGKIEAGQWPSKSRELASRLVYENWLSEFQAKRILAGRGGELIIGRYTILDRLGSGSMGRVFKAQHQLMGRTVALKVIAPELITNERVVSRFLREMRLVARLDHPNVVRAFDADRMEELFFIVMEYVQGNSLGDLLKQGPLSPVEVIRYGSQAALGLGHAHEQGILHRDVKPSNLILSDEQKIVKILDLGLGTLMEVDPEESFRTADGIAVGTIDYMSPEQASGKSLDGRSDLYSLACCMYHLMAGRCPFQNDNAIKRLALRINTPPTPLRHYLPNLPGKVVAVMDRMLATNPSDRYQTGAEASEALLSLLVKKRPIRTGSGTVPVVEPGSNLDAEAISAENDKLIGSSSSQDVSQSVHDSPILIDLQSIPQQTPVTTDAEPLEKERPKSQSLMFAVMFAVGLCVGFVAGFLVGQLT